MITYGHSSPSSLSSPLSSSPSSRSSSHNWVVVVTPQQRDNWNISRGQIGFPNSPKCDYYSISKPCNSNYQNHYHRHDDHMTMWSCDWPWEFGLPNSYIDPPSVNIPTLTNKEKYPHMKRNQRLLLLFWLSSPAYRDIWWSRNAMINLKTIAAYYIVISWPCHNIKIGIPIQKR